MHQQDSSHLNLCLGAKLQCLAMIGWAWHNTSPTDFKSQDCLVEISNLSAMMHANKQALKYIQKSNKRNQSQTSGKELVIPIGNHVLLRDHPEGRNKILNRCKPDVYIVVGHHEEPNIYYIKLLSADKDAKPKVVNRCQLFDLKQSVPPSVGRNSVDDLTTVLSFLHNNRKSNFGLSSNIDHNLNLDTSINLDSAKGTVTPHYNTRARQKATAAVRPVVVEMIITCL